MIFKIILMLPLEEEENAHIDKQRMHIFSDNPPLKIFFFWQYNY